MHFFVEMILLGTAAKNMSTCVKEIVKHEITYRPISVELRNWLT